MSCKIKTKHHKDTIIIEISGRLITEDASKAAKILEKIFKKKNTSIIVDLTELEYIDSHGLGVFVFAWKHGIDIGKNLFFHNPRGFVLEMFEETRLISVLKFTDSLEIK